MVQLSGIYGNSSIASGHVARLVIKLKTVLYYCYIPEIMIGPHMHSYSKLPLVAVYSSTYKTEPTMVQVKLNHKSESQTVSMFSRHC